jgi:hypothetical protein
MFESSGIHCMRLIRYCPEHQEPMLAPHRSAIEVIMLGMSRQEDEADLISNEYVPRNPTGSVGSDA